MSQYSLRLQDAKLKLESELYEIEENLCDDLQLQYGKNPETLKIYILGLHDQFYYDSGLTSRVLRKPPISLLHRRSLIQTYVDTFKKDEDIFERLCLLLLQFAKRRLLFHLKTPQTLAQLKTNTVFKIVMNVASPYSVRLIEKFLRAHSQTVLAGQTSSAIAWKIAVRALTEKKIALPPPVIGQRNMTFLENDSYQDLFVRFMINTAVAGYQWMFGIAPLNEKEVDDSNSLNLFSFDLNAAKYGDTSDRNFSIFSDTPYFRVKFFDIPNSILPASRKDFYTELKSLFKKELPEKYDSILFATYTFSDLDQEFGDMINISKTKRVMKRLFHLIDNVAEANKQQYRFTLNVVVPDLVKISQVAPTTFTMDRLMKNFDYLKDVENLQESNSWFKDLVLRDEEKFCNLLTKVDATLGDVEFIDQEKSLLRLQIFWQDALTVFQKLGWDVVTEKTPLPEDDVADMTIDWFKLMSNIPEIIPLWSIMHGYGCLYVTNCKGTKSKLFSLRKEVGLPTRINSALMSFTIQNSLKSDSEIWFMLRQHPLWYISLEYGRIPTEFFENDVSNSNDTSMYRYNFKPFYNCQTEWSDPRESKEKYNERASASKKRKYSNLSNNIEEDQV